MRKVTLIGESYWPRSSLDEVKVTEISLKMKNKDADIIESKGLKIQSIQGPSLAVKFNLRIREEEKTNRLEIEMIDDEENVYTFFVPEKGRPKTWSTHYRPRKKGEFNGAYPWSSGTGIYVGD